MDNVALIQPKLHHNVEIHAFDDGDFLVHQTEYDYRIKVTKLVKHILDLVDGERRIGNICSEIKHDYQIEIEPQQVHDILYEKLALYGILASPREVKKVDNASYISMRITLFSTDKVEKASHLLGVLFDPGTFYITLLIYLTFIGVSFGLHFSFSAFTTSIDKDLVVTTFFLNVISLFLHELGHATACRRFGARHGGIGFGFYMLSPVVFADVSDAWKLIPAKRIIIDLAGFYMQAIFTSSLLLTFYFTGDVRMLQISFLFLIGMFLNLNPFFRRDGYWALSDALKIANLKRKSNNALARVAKTIVGQKDHSPITKQDYFLTVYGVLDWSFIAATLLAIIFNNPKSLLYFPYNLFLFLQTVYLDIPDFDLDWIIKTWIDFLLPIVFYMLLFKILIRPQLRKILKQKIRKT